MLLLRMLTDLFEEGRFSRSGLTGKKNRLMRMRDQIQRILEFQIIGV